MLNHLGRAGRRLNLTRTFSTMDTLSGSYDYTPIKTVKYGPGSIKSLPDLIEQLAGKSTKALIITGNSLATKTPVIKNVEEMLKSRNMYGGTFKDIAQHAPVKDIKNATSLVKKEGINVLVSIGGGSPVDSGKAIAYFIQDEDKSGQFMPHIAVPTTLSAAELTQNAGFTSEEGHKIGVAHPANVPRAIIYDAELSLHTPNRLWVSSGVRALDHALENLYREGTPGPVRVLCREAVGRMFDGLNRCHANPEDVNARQASFEGAWMSLFPLANSKPLGLSHGLGHMLGATYSIPHGICSCLTLGATIALMAKKLKGPNLLSLARAVHDVPSAYKSPSYTPDLDSEAGQREAANEIAIAVNKLLGDLGLTSRLSEYKVPKEDLEGIAKKVSPEGAPYTKDEVLHEILEKVY